MTIASISLSNEQRRALADMGIDVWVRRGVAKPVAAVAQIAAQREKETVAPTNSVTVVAEQRCEGATREPVAAVATDATQLRVALDCMSSGGTVVVGDFADPLDRRLAHDVALAIGGVADVQRAQFRWPQTVTGDSTLSAARNAYRGFLRGQIDRAGAHLVLLFGAGAQLLFDAEGGLGDVEILRTADARDLRADPMAKKQLWLSVSPHVRA